MPGWTKLHKPLPDTGEPNPENSAFLRRARPACGTRGVTVCVNPRHPESRRWVDCARCKALTVDGFDRR